MRKAVALLLEVPDGVEVTSEPNRWRLALTQDRVGVQRAIIPTVSAIEVLRVEVHDDPDAVFPDDEKLSDSDALDRIATLLGDAQLSDTIDIVMTIVNETGRSV